MKVKSNRIQERSTFDTVLKFIHDYAYFETIIIVSLYLTIGYLIDSKDICMLNGEISYIIILLAIITLFHGFENGILSMAIISFAMWFSYPSFEYTEFLVALMMTMIFSEFHYYWTKKIKEAEINSTYRGTKLDELSKAFYTLKISHDQLEKNYVIKPMSIRHSIEYIIEKNRTINETDTIIDKNREYYLSFLGLLEKSFNVQNALILYKHADDKEKLIDEKNAYLAYTSKSSKYTLEDILSDYLVDKAINRHTPIYISDKSGEPTINSNYNSEFIGAIPALLEEKVVCVLIIKKMPFMSFNRENLTSISILLEYFSIEIRKKHVLRTSNEISIVKDEEFRFEYARLRHLYKNFNTGSINLLIRVNNELQATRIYEKVAKMLRSLDMVTMIENNEMYYIILMFPLHDKAAALGYLNRLLNFLDEEKDKKFDFMTFDMSQTKLLNKYLREDYGK